MDHFKSALQFLTLLPLGKSESFDTQGMTPYFPLAGIIVGVLISIFDKIALLFWPLPAVAAMDVVFLALLTGAFHLDGLGDAADGMLGHRTREKALEIMKDSRIGAMGLMAIFCCLLIKWAGILSLDAHQRTLILILVPAYSRSGMLFGMRSLPYGRTAGTGIAFFQNTLAPMDFKWMALPILLSAFLGWRGLWLNLMFAAVLAAILGYYRSRMGCITGDMLGAMTEIMEAVLFLAAAAGWLF
jgi:adenosylcobinamide-GDP ribazoletransferase